MAPATKYGGQVSARVMVRLNPRPLTTEGNYLLLEIVAGKGDGGIIRSS